MNTYPRNHMRRSGTANYQVLTDPRELELMYKSMTLTNMAEQLGCTRSTVKRYLVSAGITLKVHGKRMHSTSMAHLTHMTARKRVQLSAWRLMLAAYRCPFDCPYFNDCPDEYCNNDTCKLRRKLNEAGEMAPRPWEPHDWVDRFDIRMNGNGRGET